MTKDEMKNKCAERTRIFQQAMESCKSSNPIDCIEWFADRIADLEKENAVFEEDRDKYRNMVFDKIAQLDQAKEIIMGLLTYNLKMPNYVIYNLDEDVIKQAESYLSSSERPNK